MRMKGWVSIYCELYCSHVCMVDNAASIGRIFTIMYIYTCVIVRLTRREKREVEYKETVYKLAKEHEKVCVMNPP